MCQKVLFNKNNSYTIDDVQIICPQRTSEIGVEAINKRMQEFVNPPSLSKQEVTRCDVIFSIGDKLLHTVNDY
jgi:exodeoxyribonuclease V alpha subunit